MHYIGQSLIAIDSRACLLRWGASMESDFLGYNVYMSLTNEVNTYKKLNTSLLDRPEFLYGHDLRHDQEYYFYVTSVDELGNESDRSNIFLFQLSNYVDEEVIVVDIIHEFILQPGTEHSEAITQTDFLTKFELGGSI